MKIKEIRWSERYSQTMEDDKFGRWARIAYAGDFENVFKDGKPVLYELAWIKKLKDPKTEEFLNKFSLIIMFPDKGPSVFNTLEEAKQSVVERFNLFMLSCLEEL